MGTLVFGPEAKRGGVGGGSEKNQLILHSSYFKGGYSSFLGQCWVHPSEGVGRSLPLGVQKLFPLSEILSKLGAQHPQFHQCLPTCTHPIPYNQYTKLNSRQPDKLGAQVTFCISLTQDEIMSLVFSNLSLTATER